MTTASELPTSAPDVDAGARQVGVVYARALYAAAEKAGALDQVMNDFQAVMNLLAANPRLARFSSGMMSTDERVALFRRAFEGQVSPLFLNFLLTVARHDRQQALAAVFHAFQELNDARIGQVRVEVITPVALEQDVRNRLVDALKSSLGHQPILQSRVEPRLIGGLMLRVGDTLFDGSVATQLEKIRTQMIDRTVHEIQSRRDRFRPAEGN